MFGWVGGGWMDKQNRRNKALREGMREEDRFSHVCN